MSNTRVFKNIIEIYKYARPGYPDGQFSDIVSFASLRADARILEIGAGPGLATDYFVKNGYRITALEISEQQVSYLRRKYRAYPNFKAVRSAFEAFSGAENAFDLIFSATAFHWIAPEIGYPKAYAMLKPGGAMAVFWHIASIIEPQTNALKEIREICRAIAPEQDDYLTAEEGEELHRLRLSQFQTGRLFPEPVSRTYRWNDAYSTDRYLQLMQSYSDFHETSAAQQRAMLDGVSDYLRRCGEPLMIPQEVRLYLAKKNEML